MYSAEVLIPEGKSILWDPTWLKGFCGGRACEKTAPLCEGSLATAKLCRFYSYSCEEKKI